MLTSEIDALNCRCYNAKATYRDRFPFPEHFRNFYGSTTSHLMGKRCWMWVLGQAMWQLILKIQGF